VHEPLGGINISVKRSLEGAGFDSSPGKWVRPKRSVQLVIMVG